MGEYSLGAEWRTGGRTDLNFAFHHRRDTPEILWQEKIDCANKKQVLEGGANGRSHSSRTPWRGSGLPPTRTWAANTGKRVQMFARRFLVMSRTTQSFFPVRSERVTHAGRGGGEAEGEGEVRRAERTSERSRLSGPGCTYSTVAIQTCMK